MTQTVLCSSAIAGCGGSSPTAAADPQPWPTRAMQVSARLEIRLAMPTTASRAWCSLSLATVSVTIPLSRSSRVASETSVRHGRKPIPTAIRTFGLPSSSSRHVLLHRPSLLRLARLRRRCAIWNSAQRARRGPLDRLQDCCGLVLGQQGKAGALTFGLRVAAGSASHMAAERLRVASPPGIYVASHPIRGAEGLSD